MAAPRKTDGSKKVRVRVSLEEKVVDKLGEELIKTESVAHVMKIYKKALKQPK